jgi:hypothetical protein
MLKANLTFIGKCISTPGSVTFCPEGNKVTERILEVSEKYFSNISKGRLNP